MLVSTSKIHSEVVLFMYDLLFCVYSLCWTLVPCVDLCYLCFRGGLTRTGWPRCAPSTTTTRQLTAESRYLLQEVDGVGAWHFPLQQLSSTCIWRWTFLNTLTQSFFFLEFKMFYPMFANNNLEYTTYREHYCFKSTFLYSKRGCWVTKI